MPPTELVRAELVRVQTDLARLNLEREQAQTVVPDASSEMIDAARRAAELTAEQLLERACGFVQAHVRDHPDDAKKLARNIFGRLLEEEK